MKSNAPFLLCAISVLFSCGLATVEAAFCGKDCFFPLSTRQDRQRLAVCKSSTSFCAKKISSTNTNTRSKSSRKNPKKRKRGFGSGSGSGDISARAPNVKNITDNVDGDYIIFPELDQHVVATLTPSTSQLMRCGELPSEVYCRLDQIYGLTKFNFKSRSHKDLPKQDLDQLAFLSDMLSIEKDDDDKLATERFDPIWSSLPTFDKFRVLHIDPLVLSIDDFMTEADCDSYIARSLESGMKARSATVGKDVFAQAQRTSTTWYHHFDSFPELMCKGSRLLGLNSISCWEEPQTVRYQKNEKFTWHLDALGPVESRLECGGQRIATLLVYLTELDVEDGGATMFRDLVGANGEQPLRVQPKKGSALLFFPSAGGIPNTPVDIRTLHCGEVVHDTSSRDKWIAQLWLRERDYVPTAPSGNLHSRAQVSMKNFCSLLSTHS